LDGRLRRPADPDVRGGNSALDSLPPLRGRQSMNFAAVLGTPPSLGYSFVRQLVLHDVDHCIAP
jgi:hypothetical protein